MAVLIDTSVFVTLERRDLPLSALLGQLGDEPAALSAITVAELLHGAHRADTQARRLRRESFAETLIEVVTVHPFEVRAARVHAAVGAVLVSVGQTIGANDLIIAATALAHDFGVLTENVREFERVPGLVVRRPDWDAASR
ncbi:MAG: PIN domain-containing protein [Dehalococcoidia bacterium]|nr:PIN domain-containing protein [Dehalococcoidia bacterium]